mgnify:CR=1 FL=1
MPRALASAVALNLVCVAAWLTLAHWVPPSLAWFGVVWAGGIYTPPPAPASCLQSVTAGANPIAVKRGLDKTAEYLVSA